MKTADKVLPFVITISIAAALLVLFINSPAEKEVLCGDVSIAQERVKKSYIDWSEVTEKCNQSNCISFKSGTKQLRPDTSPLAYQIVIVIGALVYLLSFWYLMSGYEDIQIEGENIIQNPSTYSDNFRFLWLLISGFFFTAALAIFLGNVTGNLSPTFIESCKSNPSVDDLCKGALLNGKEDFYVKVNCTTPHSVWHPYRSSTFPLYISIVTYSMCALSFWAVIKSIKLKNLCGWLTLGFGLVPAAGFIIGIGFVAVYQLEAFWIRDVCSGWALGLVMAGIFVGMMLVIYPKWNKPSGPLLPQTTKDVLSHVTTGSKATSALSGTSASKK